jgi:predicted component of type VI protein secretion system
LILESGREKREIRVTGTITIGRSTEATVHVDDKTLSREHTQVLLQGGRLLLKDLGSKNGTYLNGSLIKQTVPLKNGDRFKVGPAMFTVVLEAGDAMPAVTAPLAPPPPAPRPAAPRPAPHPHPRSEVLHEAEGTSAFMILVYRAFLIGVVIVGAFLSKPLFAALLPKIPQ